MSNFGKRVFLIVIGWKPMILRTDEGLEEAPGLSGNLPQKSYLIGTELRLTAAEGFADPPHDQGGDKPKDQNGQGIQQEPPALRVQDKSLPN